MVVVPSRWQMSFAVACNAGERGSGLGLARAVILIFIGGKCRGVKGGE